MTCITGWHLSLYQITTSIFLPTFPDKGNGLLARIKKSAQYVVILVGKCSTLTTTSSKLKLKWYARKYGKQVADCNEAYTSKTRSWDGTVDDKIGSSKNNQRIWILRLTATSTERETYFLKMRKQGSLNPNHNNKCFACLRFKSRVV